MGVFISDKKSSASQPNKKGSTRRHKAPLSNGKVANGVAHLTNGGHSRAALNSDDSLEGSVSEPQLNGHHTGKVTQQHAFWLKRCTCECPVVSQHVHELFQNGY